MTETRARFAAEPWKTNAIKIFGPHWQTPLAKVAGVSRRAVAYWASGDPARSPPEPLCAALASIAAAISPEQARAYGDVWLAWMDDSLSTLLSRGLDRESMARKFSQDRRGGKLRGIWQHDH